MSGLVQLLEIYSSFSQIDSVHTASDINAHNIRDCLIHDGHGCSNRAALSGMDVRHDTDPAALGEFIITHAADLLDCFFLDYASLMVEDGMGYALCFDRLINTTGDSPLTFRPLFPQLRAAGTIIWKKYQVFPPAVQMFINKMRELLS